MKLTTFGVVAALGMITSSAAGLALAAPSSVPADPAPTVVTGPAPGPGLLDFFGTSTGSTFDAGETLHVTGRLGHGTLAAGRTAETFVHLDLRADAELEAAATAPLNLAIVMDRSRSMRGQRMENALAATRGMIDRLHDGDTVSVIVYNTQSTVLIPPTTLGPGTKQDLQLSLRNIEARGHTCISCGVEAGLASLRGRQGAVDRLLLLSDGQANTGVRDEQGFRALAAQARDEGVSVSSLGVDVDYDERLLLAVAQASNGRHYFVENPAGLARVFDEELRSLKQTVVTRAEAVVDLAPGVEVAQVFDRAFTRRGDQLVVPFGTFAAGDDKSLLLKVRVSRSAPGLRDIANVSVRYRDLTTSGAEVEARCEGALAATMTRDAAAVSPLDPFVETRLARAETSAALSTANAQFAAGDVPRAQATLKAARGRIRRRRGASQSRIAEPFRKEVDKDFEFQVGALDDATKNFDEAVATQPAAAPTSRVGKSSIRQNADALSGLGL